MVLWPVLRIHDILVWIQLMDPDLDPPDIFVIDLQEANKKLGNCCKKISEHLKKNKMQ